MAWIFIQPKRDDVSVMKFLVEGQHYTLIDNKPFLL
jgi:hypothetical protein